MQTTLIIPTLNRPDDLTRCLKSITQLSQPFDEIIIVEQGDIDKTKMLVASFTTLNIKCFFQQLKSLTQARNLGVKKSHGAFIFFVDDDTELDKDYIPVALDFFAKNPKVVGMTGKIDNKKINLNAIIRRYLSSLLGFNSFKSIILRSGDNSGVFYPDKLQKAQWLAGCHCAYRRAVFDAGFRFNKDFIRWSFGEDVMFSYQVYQHYGKGSLMYVPEFRLLHHSSDDESLSDQSIIKMMVIYRFIFWKLEVYQGSLLNSIYYLYAQLGLIFYITKQAKDKFKALSYLIKSYRYLAKNWRKIENNGVDYNAFILEENKKAKK